MKKSIWIYACCLLAGMSACSTQSKEQVTVASHDWEKYDTGIVEFEDKAPASKGSDIYHRIIPDAASYITEQARTVLATLYYSPEDSITPVRKIHYTLEDIDGISAKGGGNGEVSIFYSTRHIEKSFAQNDTAKLLFETRGVLLHELTNAYQLEPQGIGTYGSNWWYGPLLKEWPMRCAWPMADSKALMPVLKGVITWMVIARQGTFLSGCVTTKILIS